MRVLLAIHHPLSQDLGAPGVTLALGRALQARGCTVDFYSYGEAFPGVEHFSALHNLRFPWVLSAHLARVARRYDVLDVTTGDAWPWAQAGRPGAARRHALVTRSHGLEHTVSEQLRADAREGKAQLSWKYPLYHGGFRLWEVARTLRLADRTVLLNAADMAYARERLRVPVSKLSLIPHGLAQAFHGRPLPAPPPEGPLRLATVGTFIQRKGREDVIAAVSDLHARGLAFTLTLYGTGTPEPEVRAAFPASVQSHLRVVPHYAHATLPDLLANEEVLLFPSHAEGYGMALVEAMASGLVPVSTPVGVAPSVVQPGRTGLLFPIGDVAALVAAVRELAADAPRRYALRRAAQLEVQGLTWPDIAARTLSLYAEVLRIRADSR
ncbi:glycosyltransferase family 4 protein [Corallococcus exiguus]|uniref:glycosyltransferase family 4 protein n=1 Tax=Corallococcus exiguus TaxID=83462 RepID=UPI001471E534|nr:glycosyltransferase family 4 protein [Corallococcus exiguus]NNB85166.1 glycosyltransferase family 4 protein [Corallococcus exiguus]NNC01966.1 glycosyltransferase family 4 protein [Corallococcus exiguus]